LVAFGLALTRRAEPLCRWRNWSPGGWIPPSPPVAVTGTGPHWAKTCSRRV